MRQKIFLLSAACFYFLLQTANLALGIPAPIDTDKDVSVSPISDSNESHTGEALKKRNGAIRDNLGQAVCNDLSDIEDDDEIYTLYKLYNAQCLNDKQYGVECRKYIPHTEEQAYRGRNCLPDEICKTKDFKNAWGILKKEVYCQKQEKKEVEWAGAVTLTSNCSPGVTTHDLDGARMAFSSQFFSNLIRTTRANVGHAWIQTNKKGIIAENYNGNGLYVQVLMSSGETAQACFARSSANEAQYASLVWAEEDL